MTQFNDIQKVKRRFFALRNGIIADTLRKAGCPHKIIFGLNMPQIKEIASEIGHDENLALHLWANTSTRESMLLAPMLIDTGSLNFDKVTSMVMECPSTEILDNLCHSLLRLSPHSYDWALKLAESDSPLMRYAAMRLLWHHLSSRTEEIKDIAKSEVKKSEKLTLAVARHILDEIDFMSEQ